MTSRARTEPVARGGGGAGTGAAAGHVHQDGAGRGRGLLVRAAQALPHLERVGALGAGAGGVQQAAVGGLQEDRVGAEVGEDAEHLGDPAAAEQGVGAASVHLLGTLEEGVVAVDDLGVDLLGDRHEGHLPVQLHQRQAGRAGGVHERRGEAGEARAQLHDEGRDAAFREGADEGALLGGPGAEAVAGGEEEFAALEEGGDVGHLAGVHPADGAVQAVGAGEDLGEAAAEAGEFQGALHGDARGRGCGGVHGADGTSWAGGASRVRGARCPVPVRAGGGCRGPVRRRRYGGCPQPGWRGQPFVGLRTGR